MTGDSLPDDRNFFQTSLTLRRLDVESEQKSEPTKREQVHMIHTHSLAST